MTDLDTARERYAEELRQTSAVKSTAIIRAFATVKREHFLGPGPWKIMDLLLQYSNTPDANPIHLYRDVLVAIDAARFLNNGQPSGHALWIDALNPQPGEHVVHVGCGTGYYSAILADIVGPSGRVTAIERDEELAARARANLAHLGHVEVMNADGCAYDPGPADAIYVNAGATHPLALWLDRLRPCGRLTVPLVRWPSKHRSTQPAGAGILMKVMHADDGYTARVISPIAIFPCIGAVDGDADRALEDALNRGFDTTTEYALRRDHHEPAAACWLHGRGYCFTVPAAAQN